MGHTMFCGARHRRAHRMHRIHAVRHDIGLLALRLGAGGILFAHGSQKLFGWFGGYGLKATGQSFEQIGFRPGREMALLSGIGEAGSGTLLALGLGTPGAGAAAAAAMAGAASVHAPAGFFNDKGGLEFPAFLGLSGAALALSGPGSLSLDHLLDHRINRPWMPGVAFAVAAAAAAFVITRRQQILQQEQEQEQEQEQQEQGSQQG